MINLSSGEIPAHSSSFRSEIEHVPPEIINRVLEMLSDDNKYWKTEGRKFFKSLCLVSSAWRDLALPFIYSEIRLVNRADFHKAVGIFSAYPVLPEVYLRKVRYEDFYISQDPLPTDIIEQRARLANSSLVIPAVKMPRLPRVTHLDWSCSRRSELLFTPQLAEFLRSFPSLTRLTLSGTFRDLYVLRGFINACGPRLKYLHFKDLRLRFASQLGELEVNVPVNHAEELVIDGSFEALQLEYILFYHHSSIKELRINCLMSSRMCTTPDTRTKLTLPCCSV